jgi:RNA polymerase sigma-70 factor (ECF subfamily)
MPGLLPDASSTDREAELDFRSFYETTLTPLRRYLSRIVGCRTEAQDIAQIAFLRLRAVLDRRTLDRPQAYLYTTARRLAIDELRRRRADPLCQHENDTLDAVVSNSPSVERVVMARQELNQLLSEIDALPPGCRAVILLSRIENLSHQQIADKLGIAYSTVEKQHARALRLLRETLRAGKPSEIP